MNAYSSSVRFAFQPLYSLHNGAIVAVEALARPPAGTVSDLLRAADKQGQLTELDVALAAQAVHSAAQQETLLPLHINVLATSAAGPLEEFAPLLHALSRTGRRAREVVLEIGPPYTRVPGDALLRGLHELINQGFRIALDGVGDGDLPMTLLANAPADTIKLDRRLISGLPEDSSSLALIESLIHLAVRNDARLVAEGVESEAQLDALRRLGIRLAQGNLFAGARYDMAASTMTLAAPEPSAQDSPVTLAPQGTPRVRDFLRPAMMLPEDATSDEVREVFASEEELTGVVLVDPDDHPLWSIDRNRFLLAVTGPYGHALHARRGAARLADPPHVIGAEATALQLLDLVTDADWSRTGDNVIVVDSDGRCIGMVRVTEIVRGIAEVKIEQAAALNPLTRLPGSDVVARDVDRRIAAGQAFVMAWLDVDGFKAVNDTVGFAAGDDLLRELGRTLSTAAENMRTVTIGHVGGDDFLLVTDLNEITPLANAVLDTPWRAEGMPVSVSLATLVCAHGSTASYREAARLLAPLKKGAKDVRESSWVLGRPGTERVDVLRGRRHDLPHQRAVS